MLDETGLLVDAVYESVNPAAARYLARDAEHLVGRRFTEVSGGEAAGTVLGWFAQVLETGEPLVLDDFAFGRSGSTDERWLECVPSGSETA